MKVGYQKVVVSVVCVRRRYTIYNQNVIFTLELSDIALEF